MPGTSRTTDRGSSSYEEKDLVPKYHVELSVAPEDHHILHTLDAIPIVLLNA